MISNNAFHPVHKLAALSIVLGDKPKLECQCRKFMEYMLASAK